MTRTAIYARISTNSADQQNALQQQLDRLRKAAPDALEYIETESGTKTDRPVWDQLMEACRNGSVSRVIATRLDRISRSRVHGVKLLQYFMTPTAPSLELLDDSLDLSTSGGRFMAHLLIGWSASESERLGERTKHGHAHRRSQLKPFGPRAPFGLKYTTDKSNYELDEVNAPIALDLINQFASEGRGLRGCVKYAFEKYGVRFGGQSSFKRWLLNPSLCGFRVYGVSQVTYDDDGNKKRTHNRPGVYGEIHPNAHPALITEVKHACIVAMFEAPRDQALMQLKDGRVRVATGLGLCGHCLKRLHVHKSGTKLWYRCGNSLCERTFVNRIREDELISTAIDGVRYHAKELAGRAAQVTAQIDGEPKEITELREQIADYRSKGDPDLEPVITKKERALTVKLQQVGQGRTFDMDALEELMMSEEMWADLWETNPSHLRDLLRANVFCVLVTDGEATGIKTRWD